MTNIDIRPAKKKDIPHIQHIVAVSWPATYGEILSREQLVYMIDLFYSNEALTRQMDSGHDFFILWADQRPVGFMDIEKDGDSSCKLHKIYLLPASQGKGWGKELLLFAIRQGQKMGSLLLKLNVNRRNKALNFYKHMGFVIDHSIDLPVGQGYYMNDYVMVRPLTF